MASSEDSIEDLERRLLDASAGRSVWQTADDLGRLSFESLLAGTTVARTLPSSGSLRLSGTGVLGSAAPLLEVARTLNNFQRLATAVAASDAGDTELGRQASTQVVNNTRLLIAGAPMQGSLVFTLTPDVQAVAEVHPADGLASMFRTSEDDDQQVDKAVAKTTDLIATGLQIPPDPTDSAFLSTITELGPRAASCARDFAKGLHKYGFDVDLEWRQPHRLTRRVRLNADTADRIAKVIEQSSLD